MHRVAAGVLVVVAIVLFVEAKASTSTRHAPARSYGDSRDGGRPFRVDGATATQASTSAAPPAWLTRVASWIEAVNEHTPGEVDRPARVIAFWTELDLEFVRTDYVALVALCRRELGRSVPRQFVPY